MNLADALEKLRTMIRNAEKPYKIMLSAQKLERNRKKWVALSWLMIFLHRTIYFSQEEAARNRLRLKRERSETKQGRQAPIVD